MLIATGDSKQHGDSEATKRHFVAGTDAIFQTQLPTFAYLEAHQADFTSL
jgi:hypothetical protein